MNEDLKIIHTDVKKLKQKTEILEVKTKEIEMKQNAEVEQNLVREAILRKKCLRIRGLKESPGENLYDIILPFLAEIREVNVEVMEAETDKIYRISSNVARKQGFARDILVHFLKERTRDRIVNDGFGKTLKIDDSVIKIFRDVPSTILRRRKE